MTARAWKMMLLLTLVTFMYLGLRPSVSLPDIERIDLAAHLVFNAGLAWMAFHAFPSARRSDLLFGALLCYGGAIEILQSFTETRVPSLLDFLANGAGLLVGALAARGLQHWRRHRTREVGRPH